MKIAVLRALQLGDMLCAVPALRALRAEYPAARITLIGLPWARKLAARFRRYVYDFMEFPGFPGLPERACDVAAVPRFFREARKRGFDLVLQMHGSGEIMNPLAVLAGGQRTAGFCRPGHYCPDPERYMEWRDEEHEVQRYLRLMAHLGVAPQGSALEFPLSGEDWSEWTGIGLERDSYAVVHPGAQLASRRWPPERFAQVADALAAEGLQIVLTGSAGEKPLVETVRQAMRSPALDLAGLTSLGGLAALVARARLVVANDTGISHIAAAVKAPSVIVASGSDPKRWAPLDRQLHRVLFHEIECRPCKHAACPIGHPCALGVSPEQVSREALSLVECVA
ncbi:MAG: glycosyltransferase family 9 protein [Betaproteobacteria bacterium]|nr:MAG: glycosyltransferase family 9 protein [Betaproteobacteria bacterium]